MINQNYKVLERIHNGEWVPVEFEDLAVGDVFRIVSPPGDDTLYTALSRPQPIPDQPGNWALNIERSEPPAGLTPNGTTSS